MCETEDLLAAVARATGSPVYVPEKRMAIINLLVSRGRWCSDDAFGRIGVSGGR